MVRLADLLPEVQVPRVQLDAFGSEKSSNGNAPGTSSPWISSGRSPRRASDSLTPRLRGAADRSEAPHAQLDAYGFEKSSSGNPRGTSSSPGFPFGRLVRRGSDSFVPRSQGATERSEAPGAQLDALGSDKSSKGSPRETSPRLWRPSRRSIRRDLDSLTPRSRGAADRSEAPHAQLDAFGSDKSSHGSPRQTSSRLWLASGRSVRHDSDLLTPRSQGAADRSQAPRVQLDASGSDKSSNGSPRETSPRLWRPSRRSIRRDSDFAKTMSDGTERQPPDDANRLSGYDVRGTSSRTPVPCQKRSSQPLTQFMSSARSPPLLRSATDEEKPKSEFAYSPETSPEEVFLGTLPTVESHCNPKDGMHGMRLMDSKLYAARLKRHKAQRAAGFVSSPPVIRSDLSNSDAYWKAEAEVDARIDAMFSRRTGSKEDFDQQADDSMAVVQPQPAAKRPQLFMDMVIAKQVQEEHEAVAHVQTDTVQRVKSKLRAVIALGKMNGVDVDALVPW